MSVATKVAFITGASSGLGKGLAARFARDGYAVALAARRADLLDSLAAEITSVGGQALPITCDVSDRGQVREAVRKTEEAFGPIDLAVANAGVSVMAEAHSLNAEEVERVMRINFFGSVYVAEAVLPSMIERDSGHLVAIGSLAGYGGIRRTASYSASKGALHNFFESLRADLYTSGVDVTVITPGYVRTPMTDVNDHPMPFLVELDDAVDRMAKAIRNRKRLYSFPRPLSTLVWLGQIFPSALYDRLASSVRRSQRPE